MGEVDDRIAAAAAEGQAQCSHGVTFNEAAYHAEDPDEYEVRKRWPRGYFTAEKPCPLGCNFRGIFYASPLHYIAGDW